MIAEGGIVFLGWMGAAGLMTGLHLYQFKRQNATIVDLGWAGSVGVLSLLYGILLGEGRVFPLMVGIMGLLWAMRLTIHLYLDRMRGKPEDGRYRRLREKWGDQAQFRFFLLFQAQALLAALFSLPFFLVIALNPDPAPWSIGVGSAIWVVALLGEGFADHQLSRFKKRHGGEGKTCREGLWRYSRHPNYFFEWLHWWTYVALGWGSFAFWINLLFPLLMLLFLFKLTGIPATEEQALRTRGEDYRRYQETTSVFIPWFPKETLEPR
jgi:steroid 5-alpha reductase family enzyme